MSHSKPKTLPPDADIGRMPVASWHVAGAEHERLAPLYCDAPTRFVARDEVHPEPLVVAAIGLCWAAEGLGHVFEMTALGEHVPEIVSMFADDQREQWAVHAASCVTLSRQRGEDERMGDYDWVRESKGPPPGLWLGARVLWQRSLEPASHLLNVNVVMRVLRVCPCEPINLDEVLAIPDEPSLEDDYLAQHLLHEACRNGQASCRRAIGWVVVEGRLHLDPENEFAAWVAAIVTSCEKAGVPVYLDALARAQVRYGLPGSTCPLPLRVYPRAGGR
jgi:hypothetical protein